MHPQPIALHVEVFPASLGEAIEIEPYRFPKPQHELASSQALDGIASIVDKYVQLIDRAIETDRFGLADLYLRRAVTVSPGGSEPPPGRGNHGR